MDTRRANHYSKLLNRVVNIVEGCIASILVAGILYLVVQLVVEYFGIASMGRVFEINRFLTKALDLVIGIEFTRMLFSHSTSTVIDVLMFATARQAIMDHSSVMENFLAVLAVAVLFILKKHMMPLEKKSDSTADDAARGDSSTTGGVLSKLASQITKSKEGE